MLLWRLGALTLLALLGLHEGNALAQSYPSRPIHIVVPFAPGGPVDLVARLISPKMADALKQPVLVDNRPGATGRIAQNAVAKAAPDGHTILLETPNLAVGPALFRTHTFDAAEDFIPVTQLVTSALVLMRGPKSPVASTRELIALAKSKPGSLNYGHLGVGSTLHLIVERLNLVAGIDMLGIPYKGIAPLSNALMAGELDVALLSTPTAMQSMKAGRLHALSVIGTKRVAALPDVPTLAEAGVTDVFPVIWYGLFVPAKTPRDIVQLIQREAARAIFTPDVRDRILAMGQEPVGDTPDEFKAKYLENFAQYAQIIKDARIPPQD